MNEIAQLEKEVYDKISKSANDSGLPLTHSEEVLMKAVLNVTIPKAIKIGEQKNKLRSYTLKDIDNAFKEGVKDGEQNKLINIRNVQQKAAKQKAEEIFEELDKMEVLPDGYEMDFNFKACVVYYRAYIKKLKEKHGVGE